MQVLDTYRAFQYEKYGLQQVKLNPAVKTTPLLPNQVRIKVLSAAINPVDNMILDGILPGLVGRDPSAKNPFSIGSDAAGIVVEVGKDANRFKVGDEVYTMAPMDARGTVADYTVVDEDVVAIKPSNLTFDQAASLPLVALTTYQAFFEHTKIKKGETVLILGGSSSTGIVGVQLAHAIGARVIATTSAKNADFVKSLGADQTIDYHTEKWSELLQPHSVDVIYDCGMELHAWNQHAQSILKKDTGRFITLLPMKDPVEPAKFGAKNIGHVGVYPSGKGLDAVTKFVERGELVPVVDSVYPFEELPQALAKQRTRHARGKLVIQVNQP